MRRLEWLPALAWLALGGSALCAQEAINISSDRASYESGTGIYEGNVRLTQGELTINANRLVISEQNREVNRILALGEPAMLSQHGEAGEPVTAEAYSIEYFVQSGKVILVDRAVIKQQGSEIRGNRIVYDSERQTVLAEGEKQERVNMTLQPQQSRDADRK